MSNPARRSLRDRRRRALHRGVHQGGGERRSRLGYGLEGYRLWGRGYRLCDSVAAVGFWLLAISCERRSRLGYGLEGYRLWGATLLRVCACGTGYRL